jgi:hypothetical protein
MENFFVFMNSAGKTQLRGYVKIAAGLLVLMQALLGVSAYNRYKMNAQVLAAPRPVDTHVLPTVIPTIDIVQAASVETCLSDPAQWTLTDNPILPSSNLKELSESCVRASLDKTAAWLYATYVLGYSRSEAANIFGLSSVPMKYDFDTKQISVLTDFKSDPQKVALRFPSDNTGLKEWRVNANGQPAVEFTFSGCFRTSSMSGGTVSSWGNGYPVVCQYFADFQSRYYVADANGKVLTVNSAKDVRRFMWFGYNGNGNWIFLGIAKDWDVDLAQVKGRGPATINADAMIKNYSVSPVSLPANWPAFTGQEFVDAFLKELDVSQ